jgi:hypothetical protein
MSQKPSAACHPVASQLLRFDPTVVDELADRLSAVLVQRVLDAIRAEGLIPRASEAEAWLSAKDVAKRLRMSREWVYQHAEELGASRIGNGRRPRLRFPPRVVESRDIQPASRRAAAGSTQAQVKTSGLIPIRGS